MSTQEILKVITRHTLEAVFQVMEAAVKLSQRAKTIEKKLPCTWSTLATPPIYNQVYPEKLATSSPGNPIDVTKPSLVLLLVQQNEKCVEEVTSIKKPMFW